MDTKSEILHHMALAFFASAWADAAEEADDGPNLSGKDIMNEMPRETDSAAIHAAQTLYMDMERVNGADIVTLFNRLCAHTEGAGDRPHTAEIFGHYAAMQAMGHGVGLDDAFGHKARELVRVPYVEFGSHSLSRDYF